MTPGIIAFVIFVALYFFLIWPGKASEQQKAPFVGRTYAHRGLYDNRHGVPENSLAAFDAAMKAGYGCELDVQMTADGELVVFHDDNLKRICGVDKAVKDCTVEELCSYSLLGTEQCIPTFEQVLAVVGGQNPLIVEIKTDGTDRAFTKVLTEKTCNMLDGYKGEYCLESFQPEAVRWLKKNRPDLVRGLLVEGAPEPGSDGELALTVIHELLINFLLRPHFLAYREDQINLANRIAMKLGAFSVVWTVKSEKRHEELKSTEQCIIFEGYRPSTRL